VRNGNLKIQGAQPSQFSASKLTLFSLLAGQDLLPLCSGHLSII